MKQTPTRFFCLLVGLLLGAPGLRAQFDFTDLILINPFNNPGGSIALEVNASGAVAGGDNGERAFVWSGGSATEIVNSLGGSDIFARDVNASGQVVGTAEQMGPDLAFIWSSGTGTTAITNTLSAGNADANGINDAGTVVGQVSNVGVENRSAAFRWTAGGGMVELVNSLQATGYSRANAINGSNQVAGSVDDENGDGHAVRWESDGSMTVVSAPSGWSYGSAWDINAAGWVAGYATNDEGAYRAFLWDGNNFENLGALSEDYDSYAYGLNDLGQVVGESSSGAFLYSNSQMYALNDLAADFLVDGSTVGFQYLIGAHSINDVGDIVGLGLYFDGVNTYEAGFMLASASAIPEPSTYAAIAGALGLALAVWRRRGRAI